LSAWAFRATNGILSVQADLQNGSAPCRQVEHLRSLSNYLTPNLDLLAADRWTLVAAYIINLGINLVVAASLITSMLYLPLVTYVAAKQLGSTGYGLLGGFVISIALLTTALFLEMRFVSSQSKMKIVSRFLSERSAHYTGLGAFYTSSVTCVLAAQYAIATNRGKSSYASVIFGGLTSDDLSAAARGIVSILGFWGTSACAMLVILSVLSYAAGLLRVLRWAGEVLAPLRWVAVMIAGSISLLTVMSLIVPATLRNVSGTAVLSDGKARILLFVFAPVIGYIWYSVVLASCLALCGARPGVAKFYEFLPWLLGRWLLTTGLVFVLGTTALILPFYAADHLRNMHILAVVLVVGIAGPLLLRGEDRKGHVRVIKRVIFKCSGLGLVGLLVAALAYYNIGLVTRNVWSTDKTHTELEHQAYWIQLDKQLDSRIPGYWLLILSLTILGSVRIGNNRFSMGSFYRDRLIRCYLNASAPDPDTAPVTEVNKMDIQLSALRAPGPRPLNIHCASLNIMSVARLSWQQRKACSFTFSPLHCGFTPSLESPLKTSANPRAGYARTHTYAYENGLGMGRAIAVSGAAVSPQMGFHSSRATTLLLALLNFRLGWWLPNPAVHAGLWPVSRNRVVTLARELFGLTHERGDQVYVSDGGHFENLGLYEQVKRQCRVILCIDAGQDDRLSCMDLANAVHKIRVDLGVNIELEGCEKPFLKRSKGKPYLLARIRYSTASSQPDGVLLYIKACRVPNMPPDVAAYAQRHPSFPHQSTNNQWFGETKFESYRKLGEHVVQFAVEDALESPGELNDVLRSVLRPSSAAAA
jgi:hypothetical protein